MTTQRTETTPKSEKTARMTETQEAVSTPVGRMETYKTAERNNRGYGKGPSYSDQDARG